MLGHQPKGTPQLRALPGTTAAWTIEVDAAIAGQFLPLARRRPSRHFSVVRPRWNSDIRWIGPRSPEAYRRFENAFRELGIPRQVEPMLDLDHGPRLYAGFLVTRRRCRKPDFHVDWRDTEGQAFTLMTPASDNASGFGLLYRDDSGSIREYDYAPGEAIFFTDGFSHSTKPGTSNEPVVLLCFTFGTDRMKYWDRIRATSGSQSALMCCPDGQFEKISRWQSWRRHLGWLAFRAGLRRSD
jgi:hypothetical protein